MSFFSVEFESEVTRIINTARGGRILPTGNVNMGLAVGARSNTDNCNGDAYASHIQLIGWKRLLNMARSGNM